MGITLKDYYKQRFFRLCEEMRQCKKQMKDSSEARARFIVLSIQVHSAKANVPKRYWPLANKD